MADESDNKKLPGRPPFEPTEQERRLVEELSGYGLPQRHIAALVRDGIDSNTLDKYFRRELDSGLAKANQQVGKTLFQKAIGGDTASLIWWSKAQMRWAETVKQEHTGAEGTALIPPSLTFVAVAPPKNEQD